MGTPGKLHIEKLKRAARLRYMGQKTWEAIAATLDVSVNALYDKRQTDDWQDAVDAVVSEMQQEAVPEAYAALVRAAKEDDVQAAKEILERLEGAVAQKLEHSGDIDLSAVWLEGIGEDGSESADA